MKHFFFLVLLTLSTAEAMALECKPIEYNELKDMKKSDLINHYCSSERIRLTNNSLADTARSASTKMRELGASKQADAYEAKANEETEHAAGCANEHTRAARVLEKRKIKAECTD